MSFSTSNFSRQTVWKAVQVRDLFDSLYHQYPSGQLLVWETDDLPSGSRQASIEGLQVGLRSPRLLLDGQQRLTSLTAVMLGKPLIVRDVVKPIDIVFNIFTERFEVAGPRHTIQNNWVSLTKIFTEGSTSILFDLGLDLKSPEAKIAGERLRRLENIKQYQYHINVLVHMDYDEVTRIFVRTNSGGSKLSNADLALAQISSSWHGVTKEFEGYQAEFKKRSWGLELDSGLLLRAMVVLLTNQTRFSRLFSPHSLIRELIDQHRPQVVVFYTIDRDSLRWWMYITDAPFSYNQTGQMFIARRDGMLFVITTYSVAKRSENEYFHDVGRLIAGELGKY